LEIGISNCEFASSPTKFAIRNSKSQISHPNALLKYLVEVGYSPEDHGEDKHAEADYHCPEHASGTQAGVIAHTRTGGALHNLDGLLAGITFVNPARICCHALSSV
jgi:hypothetical protein